MDLDLDHDHEDLDLKISTTPLTRKTTASRPQYPTPDNLGKWETEYRLNRVPHNFALYHYSLEQLADGADSRGIPAWKPEAIDGVKLLARKGRLGSDRKDSAMADHEARGYLVKRLSQLRSSSNYESAIGDLEAAYTEGCVAAERRRETEARIKPVEQPTKATELDEEAAQASRERTHANYLKVLEAMGLSSATQKAQEPVQRCSATQSHIQLAEGTFKSGIGAVAA
jgi:hypothetical protein